MKLTRNLGLLASALILLGIQPARAGILEFLFGHEPDILSVTDVTKEGKKFSPPTKDSPVYYEGMSLGFKEFSGAIGGVPPPMPEQKVLQLLAKFLAKQGYLGAKPPHRPSIFLVVSYGTFYQHSYGPRMRANGSALRFLGGDKLDLMWEAEPIEFAGPMVYMRNMRSITAQKVMDASSEDLFIMSIKAFDAEDLRKQKVTVLWQTKISCPARGLDFNETIPTMIEIASPNVGRETAQPVWMSLSEFHQTKVEVGEATVVEQWGAHEQAPKAKK